MRRRTGLLASIGTTFLALAVLACSDGARSSGIVAPGASASTLRANDRSAQSRNQLVPCTKRTPLQGSAVIGPDGGTLAVGPNKLVVPPGALATRTLIAATVDADTIANIEFQPEGLHFAVPAQLTVSVAGCLIPRTASADIVYLRDGTIAEEIQSVFDRQGQKISGPINHFSEYSIAFDFSGYSVAFDRHAP